MLRGNRELWAALTAILVISLGYLVVVIYLGSIPAASEFFGHSLGILGFLLMLMTETFYSMRKRSRKASWGRMSSWLQFHIFTGLVGPYLVLLHSSWKFNGLAGILTLLTVIIVLSGVIGRYIYTSVPRTVDGVEVEVSDLESQIATVESQLDSWMNTQRQGSGPLRWRAIPELEISSPSPGLIFGRALADLRFRGSWWLRKLQMDSATRSQAAELERLLGRRQQLQRQIASLAMARRALALWHAIHIPIGMVLFTVAFIHIGAAIYYATLLK